MLKSLLPKPTLSSLLRSFSYILGVETSCDDTSISLLDMKGRLIDSKSHSQLEMHKITGGIKPFEAAKSHAIQLPILTEQILSNIDTKDIKYIACTNTPGLSLSLKEGVEHSRKLAKLYNIPLLPIHHIESHFLVIRKDINIQFPYLALVISGGHTQLVFIKDLADYSILGNTRDDAIGEAIDKAARMIGVEQRPFESAGAALSRFAELGDKNIYEFPVAMLKSGDLDFSFAGVKTHLKNLVAALVIKHNALTLVQKRDLCAAFFSSVLSQLEFKVDEAIRWVRKRHPDCNRLVLCGGVASNSQIRQSLSLVVEKVNWSLDAPKPEYCTDNGVMIAWTALEYIRADKLKVLGELQDYYPYKNVGPIISLIKVESKRRRKRSENYQNYQKTPQVLDRTRFFKQSYSKNKNFGVKAKVENNLNTTTVNKAI